MRNLPAIRVVDTCSMTATAYRQADSSVVGEGTPGVCHRCGWKTLVARIGRRERKLLMTGWLYGRLCHECAHDLVSSLPSTWNLEAAM
jgi:hypothetical protein